MRCKSTDSDGTERRGAARAQQTKFKVTSSRPSWFSTQWPVSYYVLKVRVYHVQQSPVIYSSSSRLSTFRLLVNCKGIRPYVNITIKWVVFFITLTSCNVTHFNILYAACYSLRCIVQSFQFKMRVYLGMNRFTTKEVNNYKNYFPGGNQRYV